VQNSAKFVASLVKKDSLKRICNGQGWNWNLGSKAKREGMTAIASTSWISLLLNPWLRVPGSCHEHNIFSMFCSLHSLSFLWGSVVIYPVMPVPKCQRTHFLLVDDIKS
jgi:hypothetical protein